MWRTRFTRTVVAPVLVLGSSLLLAGLHLSSLDASAAGTYPRGSIDSPVEGASVSGSVTVSGWAADLAATTTSGVDGVQIFVDGAFAGDAVYGRSRPDIAAGFGMPNLINSGFLFMLDTRTVGGGSHAIEARAHSSESNAWTAYRRTVSVAGPLATPQPTSTATPTAVPGTSTPTRTPVPTATAAPVVNFPKQFGINNHLTWYDAPHAQIDVQRIQAAGLQSVRFDVQWDKLEPAVNTWSASYLSELDMVVGEAVKRGRGPLLVLMNTPAWARANVGTSATPPSDVQDYANALGYLAGRYASQPGMAYEIWNEPNQVEFWDTPGGPDALTYARMLKAAFTSIKSKAPSATVVGGAIAFNDQTFLQGLYAFGGIVGYYDAISLHPYSAGYAPESNGDGFHSFKLAVEQTMQTMAQYNQQNKPIWITEMGWSTSLVSDATRAAYLRRAVAMVRGWPQVAQFQVYLQNQTDGHSDVGLVTAQGNLTTSWLAYSLEVSVPNSSTSNVLGVVDSPQEWATVYDSMRVSGWAVDLGATAGSGVDRVQVLLDGTYVADATYGTTRDDIGSTYGSRFGSSGYQYQLSLAGVSLGTHTVEVRAHSTITGANTSYLRPITVIATPTRPLGSLDSPA
ncbi:MAG TPA: cellulase family glycosylhydrolase, partial [Chloroflexota bacterium]|nr:cellulase family glycosylhydrolase [Chloroflexota bacterium]